MFDNIALSVVIGLVVIYLLYSLLTSIVGEILAGWIQIRALMLRTAIERMLNDGYYEEAEKEGKIQPPEFWKNLFMLERPAFKSSVAGKFYDYPSIKYLSRAEAEKPGLFKHTYPSYFSSETFALTVINMLADKGKGATKIEQVSFALKVNSLHIQPETLKHIALLLDDASQDFDGFKAGLMRWFDETMDRTTGWYKKRFTRILFWLGFVVAMTYNIDSIRIAKILANDKDARAQLVSMGVELAKDSMRYKDFIKGPSDSIRPKSILDTGYSKVTKDISNANLILGLGWSLDTLVKEEKQEIGEKDPAYHRADSTGKLFNVKLESQQSIGKELISDRRKADSIQRAINFWNATLVNIRTFPSGRADSAGTKDSLSHAQGEFNDIARKFFLDSILMTRTRDTMESARAYLNHLTGNEFTSIRGVQADTGKKVIIITGEESYEWWEKALYFLVHITPVKSSFYGILVTALMLSLGAPFWFGVLNKLVSLRSAGVKPEEKKPIPGLATTNVITPPVGLGNSLMTSVRPQAPIPDLNEATLDAFTEKIAREQGIVMIALEGNPPQISVSVQTVEIQNFLQAKFGPSFCLPAKPSLPIVYTIAKPNTTHSSTGGGIANKNLPGNVGTLGARLSRIGSDKTYILSCWHVMKDNHHLTEAIIEKNIIDVSNANQLIAVVEDGFFSADGGIDVGIASCMNAADATADPRLPITAQYRAVDSFDSFNGTSVKLVGFTSKLKAGKIFHHKANVKITYPGQNDYLVKDVFTITFKDAAGNAKAPTTGGDSGAVVVDGGGAPLGMIIGGNDVFSYAIKFTNIFSGDLHSFGQYSFKI